MEAQRLIRRTPSPTDARATIVHATTRRRLRARALASIARTSAACFGGLSQAERAHLLRLMTKVTDALEAREYDAPRGAGRGRGDRARRG
jgi:DNA-binding MarR family transcriptional regulator